MSAHASGVHPGPPSHPPRIQYVSFANVGDDREYRFSVHVPDGVTAHVLRIPLSAFGDGSLRLQDGPDVCYQVLLKAMAAGASTAPAALEVGEADLASYKVAHTAAPKRRAVSPTTPAKPHVQTPFQPNRARAPILPVAPVASVRAPLFEQGQRVSHPLYGVGVTASSGGGHTSITFDQGGPRTFVTAMLEIEILSGPGTWETTSGGRNRQRAT